MKVYTGRIAEGSGEHNPRPEAGSLSGVDTEKRPVYFSMMKERCRAWKV